MPTPPIENLIPHRGDMSLIDQILDWDNDWCQTQVKVSDSHLFIEDTYLPAFVAIEYMAQSIAVLSGLRAQQDKKAINVGFLLGTRDFKCNTDKIEVSAILQIHVRELFKEENGLAVFCCEVIGPEIEIKANINVYQPKDGAMLNV